MQPMIKLIENYSDKGCALIGQTYDLKTELKTLNGSFNPRLKFEGLTVAGWVFSKKKIEAIRLLVAKHSSPENLAPVPPVTIAPIIEREIKPTVEPVKQVDKSNLLATFRKSAGKKYAEKYIELCNEANICVFHALENFMMRKKLYQFKNALKLNQTKNAKKEYHKPKFKDSPFKGRLTVKKGESNNVIETTFKNSEALEKLMKQLSKEAEEQNIFISFKFEKID